MNVSLTPELEKMVHAKVSSGLYGSSSEVVREALRFFHQFETERSHRLGELRRDLQVGIEQLKQGQSRKFDKKLVNEIKRRGRKNAGG